MNGLLRKVLSIVALGVWLGLSSAPSLAQGQCKENERVLFEQEYSLAYQMMVRIQSEGYNSETEGQKRFAPLASQIEALRAQISKDCSDALEEMIAKEGACALLVPVPFKTGNFAIGRILTLYEFDTPDTFALGSVNGFFEYMGKTRRLTKFSGEETGGINLIAHDGGFYKFGRMYFVLGGSNGLFRVDPSTGTVVKIDGAAIGPVSASAGGFFGGANGLFRLDRQGELVKVPGEEVGSVKVIFSEQTILIGSSRGLFRYDFQKDIVYKVGGDPTGPISIIARPVNYVAGGPNGVFYYDWSANVTRKASGDEAGAVRDIVFHGRDIVIGSSNGFFKYDLAQNRTIRVDGNTVGSVNVLFDASDRVANAKTRILVGSQLGLFQYENDRLNKFDPNDTGPVTKIFSIQYRWWDDWVIAAERGLYLLGGVRNTMTKLLRDPGSDVFFHRNSGGEFIFGLRGQLFYLDPVPQRFAEKLPNYSRDNCIAK